MNQGQSNWLALLQQMVLAVQSAQVFADQNLAVLNSAHPCAVLNSDVQALLDAINNSAAVQSAVAQIQQDIVRLPAYSQIT